MLRSYDVTNHLVPQYRAFAHAGYESHGRTEAITLDGASVGCGGEYRGAEVKIQISVNVQGRGTLRFWFSDAPGTLREAMRAAVQSPPVLSSLPEMRWPRGVTFSVVDGVRCDVDPSVLLVTSIGVSDHGPVDVSFDGEDVRSLAPWPVKV